MIFFFHDPINHQQKVMELPAFLGKYILMVCYCFPIFVLEFPLHYVIKFVSTFCCVLFFLFNSSQLTAIFFISSNLRCILSFCVSVYFSTQLYSNTTIPSISVLSLSPPHVAFHDFALHYLFNNPTMCLNSIYNTTTLALWPKTMFSTVSHHNIYHLHHAFAFTHVRTFHH